MIVLHSEKHNDHNLTLTVTEQNHTQWGIEYKYACITQIEQDFRLPNRVNRYNEFLLPWQRYEDIMKTRDVHAVLKDRCTVPVNRHTTVQEPLDENGNFGVEVSHSINDQPGLVIYKRGSLDIHYYSYQRLHRLYKPATLYMTRTMFGFRKFCRYMYFGADITDDVKKFARSKNKRVKHLTPDEWHAFYDTRTP